MTVDALEERVLANLARRQRALSGDSIDTMRAVGYQPVVLSVFSWADDRRMAPIPRPLSGDRAVEIEKDA